MNKFIKIFVIFVLLIIFTYTVNITSIPKNIILFQGESLNLNTLLGISLKQEESYKAMQTSSTIGKSVSENTGKIKLSLNLFNSIPLKNVTLDVIPKTKVVPVGSLVGLKLYTKGILVVGITEGEKDVNIREGDTILTVNEKEVTSTEELIKTVNEGDGKEVKITFDRNGKVMASNIKPSKSQEGTYKLGLWVRDAAAGVGTISYYEPATKVFVALGHGIQDIDTGKLINISNGEVVTASIIDVVKGESGKPRRD